MARYDKYDPYDGGFRAPLAAGILIANVEKILPVSLDTNGRVVVGAVGNTGYVGVVCVTEVKNAGDIVDVMTDGEIVECASLVAGTNYFVDAATGLVAAGTGARTATAPVTAGSLIIGHTIELTRMVVRFGRTP